MTSPDNRRAASEQGLALCGSYLERLVGDELAYLIVILDVVDGKSGSGYSTDLNPAHVAKTLRKLADDVESGTLVDAKSRHH